MLNILFASSISDVITQFADIIEMLFNVHQSKAYLTRSRMVYYFDELELLVSNYGRKQYFSTADFMTSFPADAHRKSKCTQAHFVERTLKYQNQVSKQGLLKVVTGP